MMMVTRIVSHHLARLILPLKLKRMCPQFISMPSLPKVPLSLGADSLAVKDKSAFSVCRCTIMTVGHALVPAFHDLCGARKTQSTAGRSRVMADKRRLWTN